MVKKWLVKIWTTHWGLVGEEMISVETLRGRELLLPNTSLEVRMFTSHWMALLFIR